MKLGDRIGAIYELDGRPHRFIGYGIYAGEEEDDGDQTPRLIMDRGGYIWANQCLWASETRIRKELQKDTVPAMTDEEYFKILKDPRTAEILRNLQGHEMSLTRRLTSALCHSGNMKFGQYYNVMRQACLPIELCRHASILASAMDLSVSMTGFLAKIDAVSPSMLDQVVGDYGDLWHGIAADIQDMVNRHLQKHGMKPIDLVEFGSAVDGQPSSENDVDTQEDQTHAE